MLTYLLLVFAIASAWANPLPQAPSRVASAMTRAASASSAVRPYVPYSQVPFGLTFNDTQGGKRIHPFLREDLCIQVVNKTLVPGALINVARCLNNSAPLPAQRNLFNLTTLNVTSNYTGLIAPANQTELCLSGKWHIPKNATDYATRADREISLQKCNATDPKQMWRYGVDARVVNGTGRAYKLSLNNQEQCATVLREQLGSVTTLVLSMMPCLSSVGSQLLVVVNGTSTPREKLPDIPLPGWN